MCDLRAAFEAIKVTVASRRYTWPGLHVKPQHKGCQCPRLSEGDSLHLNSYISLTGVGGQASYTIRWRSSIGIAV